MSSNLIVGNYYIVPWSPNKHLLEAIKPYSCSLHGDYIGEQAYFRKCRNSKIRPWGCLHVINIDHPDIKPWPTSTEDKS